MSVTAALDKATALDLPALPSLAPLASRKERVLSRWPDLVITPPEKDRERLVQEVKRRFETERWEDTPMSLITSAARALFDDERATRDDLRSLRLFYYDEIKASTRASFLDAMVSVYVGTYRPGEMHTRSLALSLASARKRLGGRTLSLLRQLPELFDPERAPAAIAKKMLAMDDCWTGLQAIGLRTPHAPGLMDHAHLAYVASLAPRLSDRENLQRLMAWLKPEGRSARQAGGSEAITAILEPWLKREPDQDTLTYITETLIALYRDPRVDGGGAWAGVPPSHLAVLMRWLTGENIRFFLDVLSAVDTTNKWEPRRKFWLSLHNQKRIDAAWVAFGESGADYAHQILKTKDKRRSLEFGYQTARGTRLNTSLLIMKIGKKIVVEGSHVYKVHIFQESNPRAPKLYDREYNCEVLRQLGISEAKSHNGDWQGWVKERI